MGETIRAFVAIELPLEIRRKLEETAALLKKSVAGVRWSRAAAMHLTLKFLGEISDDRIADIVGALDPPAAETTPFEVAVRGSGGFPNLKRPRVIWAGIGENPALAELAARIDQALASLGFPPENRPFHPHLTLGRVKETPRDCRAVEALAEAEFGTFKAAEFILFRSELRPGGAELYTRLAEFDFSLVFDRAAQGLYDVFFRWPTAQENKFMSGEIKQVAVVLHLLKNQPWGELVKRDIVAALASRPEIGLEFADPEGSAERQARILEELLARGSGALIVLPIDPARIAPLLRKFKAAGAPVIVLDNDVGDPALYDTLILADNRQFGRKAAEFFAETMGGVGDLVEIRGIPSTTGATDRSAGFREGLAGTRLRLIDECIGDWVYDKALEEFGRVLTKHKRIDGVFAQNDEMARAAWDAAQRAGRDSEMLIAGIDALRGENGGIQLVMAGKLAATFINPSPGKEAVEALLKLLHGVHPLKKTLLYTSPYKSAERIRAWQEGRKKA